MSTAESLAVRYTVGERVTVMLKNGSIRFGTIVRIVGGTNFKIKVDGWRVASFSRLDVFKGT